MVLIVTLFFYHLGKIIAVHKQQRANIKLQITLPHTFILNMKFVLREINPKLSPINLKGLLSNRLVHKSEIAGLIIMNNKL